MQTNIITRLKLIALCLLPGVCAYAQAPKTAPMKLFFEKVYLHTDRDYYSTGDDVWFKAYLVDAQTTLPIGYTNNLYVELISPDAKIINSETVYMDNGFGKGDIHLADSIPAGTYRLRAYSNWMRNFGDNFIFEKTLTISNTTKDKSGTNAALLADMAKANGAGLKAKPVVRFFPEGGSLVSDVTSIVAFKAEDPNGNGTSVRAGIVSSTGDTVARINSTAQGMGLFVFMPEAGKTYTVKGVFNNTEPFSTPLPATLAKGYVLHVSDADAANFRITISTNQATLDANAQKAVTLIGRHIGLRIISAPVKFDQLQLVATLPKKQFAPGVSSITIYDEQQRPQCERLVFVADSASEKILSVKTDKAVYQPKEQVKVTIKATDAAHHPVKAGLSFAAVDASVVPAESGNIVSYLLLQSEVRGKIEHAEKYFDTTNVARFKQIDLLLMTQGWRDFIWHRLADTALRISYPAENGFAFTGKVREKFADKPLPNTNVSLTVKGTAAAGQQFWTRTDSAGKFLFKGLSVFGDRNVSFSSFNDKQKKTGWLLLDSMNHVSPPTNVIRHYTVDIPTEVAYFNADAIRSRGKMRLSDTMKLAEVNIRASKFDQLFDQTTTKFGYPDLKYDITNKYYFYNSLLDFLIHEVPGARVNAADSVVFRGTRYSPDANRDVAQDILPRFVANGREDVDDLNNGLYLTLTMDAINKVTVRHVLGQTTSSANSSGSYGTGAGGDVYIIFLDLKPDAFERAHLNTAATTLNGYYEARTFYSPVYNSGNMNKTDNRTTLHWEPALVTDANGEATVSFFNADPKVNIRIVVQGLTDKGVPVFATGSYTIK